MDFVPEGCRPLTSAVERLAQVRQTTIHSAQAEIRAKLHGCRMRAFALEASTGRMHEIICDRWATEWGPRWLESGVCQLPDENGKVKITTTFFGMLRKTESATIFILEADLQRLIDGKMNAEAQQPARRAISDAEAKKRFVEWRESRGDDIPSLHEDYSHMRQFGVSRERMRVLRRGRGVINRARGSPRRGKPK
jgi:hypothetical protein